MYFISVDQHPSAHKIYPGELIASQFNIEKMLVLSVLLSHENYYLCIEGTNNECHGN